MKTRRWVVWMLVALGMVGGRAYADNFGRNAVGFAEAFKLDAEKLKTGKRLLPNVDVTLIESNAPGCIYYPGDTPKLTFQFVNRTDKPLQLSGRWELYSFHTTAMPGDVWSQKAEAGPLHATMPFEMELSPKAWKNIVVEPKLPNPKGGYALVLDLGKEGRDFVIGLSRGFAASEERVQYPHQSLDHMEPEILERLGCKGIRMGVGYVNSKEPDYQKRWDELVARLKEMHERKVTIIAEFGAGRHNHPIASWRPHLDENDVMKDGKGDAAWLPEDDPDFEEFAYKIASEFGWPKGPVIGFMLWNEPWEGLSISGWGADMLRYRKIYKHMGDAALRARKDAGVDVLIGGCDSSSNTIDKLIAEGYEKSEFWPKYLDFCSIHYQGTSAPALHKAWNARTFHQGRVKIWDTESWVANSADRVATVVATNRASGYDRALGIKFDTLTTQKSHKGVRMGVVHTDEGADRVEIPQYAWPSSASFLAVQHFLGERPFREILFKEGLPWVFVFDGMDDQAEDGTVVVTGDAGALFHPDRMLFRTVRSFAEREEEAALKQKIASLPADSPERAELEKKLDGRTSRHGGTLSFPAQGDLFSLYDFYGNPVPAKDGKIVVPLDTRGFYLRANPARPGSFEKLVEAVRKARIDGLEPVEIIAKDMQAPVESKPSVRVQLHNVLNRPVKGSLSATLGDLTLDMPKSIDLAPHETKTVELRVTGGQARVDNQYPLTVRFDGGADGQVTHEESMRVNVISKRAIAVDGKLDDWKGVVPQPVVAKGGHKATFMEKAWLPFVDYEEGTSPGVATGYLAYDDDYFYFAAKIADDTPHAGALRFAERDKVDDMFFYPEVVWRVDNRKSSFPSVQRLPADRLAKTDLPKNPEGDSPVTQGFMQGKGQIHLSVKGPAEQWLRLALYLVFDGKRTQSRRANISIQDAASGNWLFRGDLRGDEPLSTYYTFLIRGDVEIYVNHLNRWAGAYLAGIYLDPIDNPDTARAEAEKAEIARRTADTIANFERRKQPVDQAAIDKIPASVKKNLDKVFAAKEPGALWLGEDTKTLGAWPGKYGKTLHLFAPAMEAKGDGAEIVLENKVVKEKLTWPEGVRRYTYRRWPIFPSDGGGDNVQIAFNAVPDEEEDWLTNLPGRPPRFGYYKCSEYEYGLNKVAPEYGGGFEVWRLQCPGMPRKHFYPRQPKHPLEGAVEEAKLVTVHEGNTRVTEVAIPWSEIPHVKACLDAGQPVKFTYRVNHNSGGGLMELAHKRSVSRNNGQAFHQDWQEHWANEVEFSFEK